MDSLVKVSRKPQALGNKLREGLQDFESLPQRFSSNKSAKRQGFYHQVERENYYKTIADVDDGFGGTIPMCREHTHPRSDERTMCFAAIPGETVIGPSH